MASLANLWLPCVVGLVACAAVSLVIGKPWHNRRRPGAAAVSTTDAAQPTVDTVGAVDAVQDDRPEDATP